MSKKNVTVLIISLIIVLGLGIAIGVSTKTDGISSGDVMDDNNNFLPPPIEDTEFAKKKSDELALELSSIMLPEDEFLKLKDLIQEAASGLLSARASGDDISVNDEIKNELLEKVNQRYDRQYFAGMNAEFMKELSRENLIDIIKFYNTEAGEKFLDLSPKIIQNTMTNVQNDLSTWLPETVNSLLEKLKNS